MFNRLHRQVNDPETEKRRIDERGRNAQQRAQGGSSKRYTFVVTIITIVVVLIIIGIILLALF